MPHFITALPCQDEGLNDKTEWKPDRPRRLEYVRKFVIGQYTITNLLPRWCCDAQVTQAQRLSGFEISAATVPAGRAMSKGLCKQLLTLGWLASTASRAEDLAG